MRFSKNARESPQKRLLIVTGYVRASPYRFAAVTIGNSIRPDNEVAWWKDLRINSLGRRVASSLAK